MDFLQLSLAVMETPATQFARPSLETAREQIGKLLAAFEDATGYPPTLVGKLARGEPKFARSYQTTDFGFRSFDIVNSRLSALWPKDAPWPVDIPRQAPAEIEPEVLAELKARADKAHREETPPALPNGEPWPGDIPPPEQQPPTPSSTKAPTSHG